MVDEETQDVAARRAGAPVNRDARPDPGVIEGEIAARRAHEDGPSPGAAEAATQDAATQEAATLSESAPGAAKPVRTGARAFAAGALAGLIVSALAAGVGGYFLASKADLADDANRLAGLETQAERENAAVDAEAKRESAAVASLDKRVGALEASASASGAAELDKRVSALEAANAENTPSIAAAAETAQRLATQVADTRADVDAARAEIPGLSARVAKLEAGPASSEGPDLSALAARVDKIEAALAAPKSETRVAPEKASPADNAAAIAIVAGVIDDRLAAGAPFGPELAALKRLGVDPAELAALQAVVQGAPTGGALAASFDAIAPKVLAATSQGEGGGGVDRFLAHMRNLIRVRNLNETAGDDPQAIVSQIEAACRRGDIAGALAVFDKLPEAAREAAGDWRTAASARQGADAALQSIREAAIGRLEGGASP
jgi:hypothetical protein